MITPLNELNNLYRNWWLVALLTLWGGSVGFYFHTTRPALYEAQAELTIHVDFTQSGDITLLEQDTGILAAAAVFISDQVVEQVARDAQSHGILTDVPGLRYQSRFERKQARWHLRVWDPDPQRAATLADLWAQHGFAALAEAHRYALEAQSRQAFLQGLERCLSVEFDEGPTASLCGLVEGEQVEEAIQAAAGKLEGDLYLSRGLPPFLLIDEPDPVLTPETPSQFGRNKKVFAGSLVGFLLGTIAVQVQLPAIMHAAIRRR